MFKFALGLLIVLFNHAAFAADFQVGDTVLDNYAGSIGKGQILEITSGGLIKTTHTSGDYIQSYRVSKYEGVKSYETGLPLLGYQTYNVGDLAFDTYGNWDGLRPVTMWNLGTIVDITASGLVRTTNTYGEYIKIGRLKPYTKVSSYTTDNWFGKSLTLTVGQEVVDNFAGIYQSGVVEDISANGMVKTSNTSGTYIEIDRLQSKSK